jgi:ABC-type transport system involved in multi-copper enzyme maturation permease subunit
MIGRVFAIGLNTFREAIRNKVVYGIGFVVVVWNLVAFALSEMSLHEEARVARDWGLAGIALFGSITAIILGVVLLYGEIQKKTIHNILSKPIERWEFVVGKYLGMSATLLLVTVGFGVVMAGMLELRDVAFSGPILRALVLDALAIQIVAAVAVFFSSFSTPFLSGVFTAAIWFLARITPEIEYAARKAKVPAARLLAEIWLKLSPDLHMFMISGSEIDGQHVSVHGDFVGWGYVGNAGMYALLWIAVLLILASLIFRQRDFV